MDKNPATLDQALQFVKSAIANQKVILGPKRMDLKRVMFEDEVDEVNSENDPTIRAVKFTDKDKMHQLLLFPQILQECQDIRQLTSLVLAQHILLTTHPVLALNLVVAS
jgi:hypothetical protein